MKIKASLTIAIRDDEIWIQVEDRAASIRFLDITIGHTGFVRALGSLAYVPCEGELRDLDRVGKRMEHKMFEFQMPDDWRRWNKDLARSEVGPALIAAGMEDWTPDARFSSQNSFFDRDDKPMARTRIRRWVDIQEEEVS
jgi:hypothetical protein